MTRLLVVEDAPDTAKWLGDRLRAVWGYNTIVDIAPTLRLARERLDRMAYEVVIVDLSLPDGSGIDLLREQQRCHNDTRFVVATIHDDDEHIFGALHAGAHGYLLKERPAADIENALRGLREGIPPLSAPVALRMMEFFAAPPLPDVAHAALTGREREVLAMIAQGMNVAEAASLLSLSVHTVRGYVKEIYRKLGISSRAEASLKASKMGLIRD